MFIEVTSKGSPLLLNVNEVVGVGVESKKGSFILTESYDVIYVEESYDVVRALIACATEVFENSDV